MDRKLKPPLTLEEVETYETHIGNRLPENLREYLLNVSREFVGYNECNCACCYNIQEFKIDMTKEFEGCAFPEGETRFNNDSSGVPGSVPIAPVCHGFRYSIVIKGTNFGSQWYEDCNFEVSCIRLNIDYFNDATREDFFRGP